MSPLLYHLSYAAELVPGLSPCAFYQRRSEDAINVAIAGSIQRGRGAGG